MSYVYRAVDRGSIEWGDVSYAERVLAEARRQLDLPPKGISWYVRADRPSPYRDTVHGRALDRTDDRDLGGWYDEPHCADCDVTISVRADLPRRDIGRIVAHEMYHVWQERHGKPLNEDAAERFARRLVTQLEGAAA